MTFLQLVEPLRFIKHARERREQALHAERQHQLALVDSVVRGLESIMDGQLRTAQENTQGLIEVAKANLAQAEGFTTWVKSFQIASPPTSTVVTEEDEYAAEQQKLLERFGLEPGTEIPEEFKLAFELQQGFKAAVTRD